MATEVALPREIRNATLCVNADLVHEPYLDASARQPASILEYGSYVVPPHDLFAPGRQPRGLAGLPLLRGDPGVEHVGEAVVQIWPVTGLHLF